MTVQKDTLADRYAGWAPITGAASMVLRRHFLDELRSSGHACAAEILFELARALADRTYVS